MKEWDAHTGDRVRIHPACDWFMRGATHGTITSKRPNYAFVKLENIGPTRLRVKISYDNLEVVKL